MSRIVRALFLLAVAVLIAGVATCWFGVDHEIGKIPPDARASMNDTDWVGVEWILLSLVIEAASVALLAIAFAFRAWVRSRSSPSQRMHRGG